MPPLSPGDRHVQIDQTFSTNNCNRPTEPNYIFLDMHLPPAYTPYAYHPAHLPIQAVLPPYSVQNSIRNYTYPTGSAQLVRGVTFDFDTEEVGEALDDAECKEENVIHEDDDRERSKGSNGSIPKDIAEKNEETMESGTKVFTAPDSLLEEWFLELADAMTRFPSPSGKN